MTTITDLLKKHELWDGVHLFNGSCPWDEPCSICGNEYEPGMSQDMNCPGPKQWPLEELFALLEKLVPRCGILLPWNIDSCYAVQRWSGPEDRASNWIMARGDTLREALEAAILEAAK